MNFRIPLFDLNYDQQEENAVIETMRSKWISTGPKNNEFEIRFSEMIGTKYGVTLSSCTSALHLAMKILDFKEGDEVITPSLTFIATANAVKYVNATPVFCDIESQQNPTIDPQKIEKLINKNTKAVIVMHYAGFPCRMKEIKKLCVKHNLKLIEDACHAPLSTLHNKKLGSYGDISCFSFFSNKNMSTGEGGMLLTNNEEYYKRAKYLRSHGMTSLSYDRSKGHSTSYDVIELGYNYRMDDMRAAIGLIQMAKLKEDICKRAEVRKLYLKYLSDCDEIIIPFINHEEFCSNYIFPIVIKDSCSIIRDSVRDELHQMGIQTSIHYPAIHSFLIYNKFERNLPETDYFTQNEITLPMHSKLTQSQIEFICKSLKSALKKCITKNYNMV